MDGYMVSGVAHKGWCPSLDEATGKAEAARACECGAAPSHEVRATLSIAVGGRVTVIMRRPDDSLYSIRVPFGRRMLSIAH